MKPIRYILLAYGFMLGAGAGMAAYSLLLGLADEFLSPDTWVMRLAEFLSLLIPLAFGFMATLLGRRLLGKQLFSAPCLAPRRLRMCSP